MSYSGAYEEHPGPQAYVAAHLQYLPSMSYYNEAPGASNYTNSSGSFDAQKSYHQHQAEGPPSSEVNGEAGPSNGAIKKKSQKHWNNGRRYDKYGTGRTFSGRNRHDPSENSSKHQYNNPPPGPVEVDREYYSSSPVENQNPNNPQHQRSGGQANHYKPRKDYTYTDRQFQFDKRRNNPQYQNERQPRGYFQEDNQYRKYSYNNNNNTNNYKVNNGSNSNSRETQRPSEAHDYGNNNRNYVQRYSKYYNHRGNQDYNNSEDQRRGGWRKSESSYTNHKNKWSGSSNNHKAQKKLDAASQRERLEQMLAQRTLECLVCCEKIKNTDKIWSCEQCYHILHFSCTLAWANSSKLESGWRCPACQHVCSQIPKEYTCYCGKTSKPRLVPGVVPHGCGEACGRKGRTCDHKCTILCHPGPCPDCQVMVAKECGCGATSQTVKCSADTEILCGATCNRMLSCGQHRCENVCHTGECAPCEKVIQQVCFCGKVGRKANCTADTQGRVNYSCDDVCEKMLRCGNHKCQKHCHEGECDQCDKDPELVETCPCGRTQLQQKRTSCLDPVPCCDKVCAKILSCGQPVLPHTCKNLCHEGPCPPCPLSTFVRCRCGHLYKELPCSQVTTKADDARCEKKCVKKRLCGKHRCNQRCCIEVEHVCPLPCNHLLACGQHRCERTCHSGRCPPCMETSFEELYCECGANVLYPPVPCGTKPPPCNKPCSRARPCGHDVNHMCHIGPCPPCTVLCKKWCYGKHEQRSAILCYQEDFSCGLPCGKQMPCGAHKCEKPCHLGPCPLPCKQRCSTKRPGCGHPCGMPCHQPPCRESPCKKQVPVTCQCGLLKSTKPCIELAEEYKELEMAHLKEKMSDLFKDQPVDITNIVKGPMKLPAVLKILDCNEECRVFERNRRMAIGLQIRNPDLSQKLTPRYSDFMRNWAKKDPQFCQKVHEKLTELVQLAKQSKQKSRSHSFESMNRDKRHLIHEYCEHFGIESAAYDQEPNRNVVATALKDKSWLPSMSLMEVIQRENGQRKVPGPMLSKANIGKSETVALKLPARAQKSNTAPEEVVDYFENAPQ